VAVPRTAAARVRFGVFELDATTGELRRNGMKVRLRGQPSRVLSMLVSRPGELVSRDELRAALWRDEVFVDFDQGLNKAVAKIRRALGDLAASPRYLETLERQGYRFIAPVEELSADENPPGRGPSPAAHRIVWGDYSIQLPDGRHAIGREPLSAVCIHSAVVSRRHATICVEGGRVTLADHGSRNGTFLNGHRIDQVASLTDGDEIGIGPARLRFHSDPSTASTSAAPVTPSSTPHARA